MPLETDAWGADVVVTGSQKALQTPPGLGFAAVSERAWKRTEAATLPRFYWDWQRQRRGQEKLSMPFTPATSTVVAGNSLSQPKTMRSRSAPSVTRPGGMRTVA